MTDSSRRPRSRSRRFLALVSSAVLVATLFSATASTASAAAPRRVWQAQLAAGGATGTATLTAYWAGNGALGLNLTGLQPSATLPVIAYRGTCAAPIRIATLPAATTDALGAVVTTSPVSNGVMNLVWSYARTKPFAIKVGTGSTALCGVLRSAVATRIAIPSLKIDLPIVKPPSGYPLCNVAMYIQELSQPVEAGVSFIYAHARKGMFLPLLDRSKINNGASLIGMTVKVWTSDNLVTTYQITKVRRHVTSVGNVFDIQTQQLWMQTSEGPRGTVAKLIVVAKRLGSEAATQEAAHPTPHPVVCN